MLNTLLQTLLKSKGFPLSSGLPPFQTKKTSAPLVLIAKATLRSRAASEPTQKGRKARKDIASVLPLLNTEEYCPKWKQLETNGLLDKKECQTDKF
uniref:Uncharacterized protein n=1 Tax=Anguilla anguilla TaxID=7936 RepID=A0A0E9V655_ANGAN